MLDAAARAPVGAAVLAALRAVVLRVAVATGAADPSLSDAQITTLFNLSASHVASQRLYDGGLSLPSKLPWPQAKSVLGALFDSLAAARAAAHGHALAELLLRLPAAPLDHEAQQAIGALVANLEPDMIRRLTAGSDAASSSSGRSTPPPILPLPMPQPPPPPPAVPPAPPALLPPPPPPPILVPAVPVAPSEPFALMPTASLLDNAAALVAMRLGRDDGLDATERAALLRGLDDGLSVLQAGGGEARSTLLGSNVLVALTAPSGAQLWACITEASDGQQLTTAGAMALAIERCCSTMAGALFASSLLS
jgi:hypothetical protein